MHYTTRRGLPAPDDADPLGSLAQTASDLADALDNMLPRGGITTVATATAGTTYSKTISFSEPFDAPPAVALSIVSSNPTSGTVSVNNVTAAGFEIRVQRTINAGSTDVHWLALPNSG